MGTRFRTIHEQAERVSFYLTLAFGFGLIVSTLVYAVAVYLLLQMFFGGALELVEEGHTVKISLAFGGLMGFITLINYLDAKHTYREQSAAWQAKRLGGQDLRPKMFKEDNRLLHIVEEMAIAARIKMPAILVARSQESINAFVVAGKDDEVALVVSLGALKYLSRAELQALIAHEFGHIINEDVLINRHLSAILHGYYTISSWRHGGHLGISVARERIAGFSLIRNSNGDATPLGFILGHAGWLLYLYGRIVQAAYSRSRERMADARAVQYTRNRSALIGTLKKSLALNHLHVSPYNLAPEYAHALFFNDNWHKLFATHPSTEERIRTYGGVILPNEIEQLGSKILRQYFLINQEPETPTQYWYH